MKKFELVLAVLVGTALSGWGDCDGVAVSPDDVCVRAGNACTAQGATACCGGGLCLTAAGDSAARCCLTPGSVCDVDDECCNACVGGLCQAEGCDPGVGAADGDPCGADADCASCACDTAVEHACVGS